jgi:glycosyltransferase involved in cell wall biosynthesis
MTNASLYINPDYHPLVSVVIPVKNGEATIGTCLRSIRRSYYKNVEVVVVDDHSTDKTPEIARQFNCVLVAAEEGSGANAARNRGAKEAKGEILVFIDSDVVVSRETILGIVERLEEEYLDAVVGIYTARHRNDSLFSQYKNLWIRYSYMKSPPAIDWMFGAISGIRKKAFEAIGGFNVELIAQHGNDDLELGKRLARDNVKIELDMEIEVEHLKEYNLASFVKNEFKRSFGFVVLARQLGEMGSSVRRGFVNVYPSFILSTLLTMVGLVAFAGLLVGKVSPWWLGALAAVYFVMNVRFLNYLEQVRGFFAMLVMVPILFLDQVVCLVGSAAGFVRSLSGGGGGGRP